MIKSLSAALALALLVAGCVSVAPPATTAPTSAAATPTFGVTTPAPATPSSAPTATPTAAPTATSTATPTAAPTATPTAEPTASAEATPQATPDDGALARDLLFLDDLTDPSSGWDEFDETIGSVSYDGGFLAYRFNESGWAYSVRDVEPHAVVRPVAEFIPDTEGVFGLLCGNAGIYYGAVLDSDGGLVFIAIDAAGVRVLGRNDELGLDVPVGDSTTMGIQCVAIGDGSVNIEAVVSGSGPVGVFSMASGGPTSFNAVAVYGEALGPGFSMAIDNVAAYGVEGPTGQPSDGAQELITHIPDEVQIGCSESPVPPLFSEPASFVVTCVRQTAGAGAELAEYVQFATREDMDAAYQERIDAFGVESEGSCRTGPNETTWSINDFVFGRVLCSPQTVGVRYDWTDNRLDILSTLVDLDGEYGDLYDEWLNAGPNL